MSIDFDILGWLIGIGLLAIVLFNLRKRRKSYRLCFSVFWIYILFALRETLFPIEIVPERVEMYRGYFMSHVNLIPFYFGPYARFESIFPSVALNILLTIPFGFGVSFVARLKPKDFIWLTVAVGLGSEATQLVISLLLGYPYRVMDVNDTLSNATGVLIGYALFRVFSWLYVKLWEKYKFKGLGEYVYAVARRAGE